MEQKMRCQAIIKFNFNLTKVATKKLIITLKLKLEHFSGNRMDQSQKH